MSENKPELRCGSDDKAKRARLRRAFSASLCHPFLRSVRLILKSLLARGKRTLFGKKTPRRLFDQRDVFLKPLLDVIRLRE